MARCGSDGEREQRRQQQQQQQRVSGQREAPEPQLVLSLDSILRAYEQPINEEQAWAVCYQCCRSLHSRWPREHSRPGPVKELGAIWLHRDGSVSVGGEDRQTQTVTQTQTQTLTDTKMKFSRRLCTESQVVQSLGFAIYRALDWGLEENEERELSQRLEHLIDQMANCDSEGGNGTSDEGYSGQEEEEESTPRSVRTFEQVMRVCAAHLMDPKEANAHYQAVCRALFVETSELKTFLVKIKDAKELLKNMQAGEPQSEHTASAELDNLNHTDWARLWVQLMRELRFGVKLKNVQEKQYNPLPTEFQLTPFEMLMQDIRTRKYKLRKVMVNGGLPPRVKKDAHELILDFIRSRPPLKPVSERNLRPKPQKPPSLHERILEEIKSERKLRPVEKLGRNKLQEVTFGSLPCLVLACNDQLKSTSCIDLSTPEPTGSSQRPRPRVLLKAPTLAEMEEMSISEEEESPNGEIRRVTSSPIPLKRDRSFSEHDLTQLQSELALSQSESTYLSTKGSDLRLCSGSTVTLAETSSNKAGTSKEVASAGPWARRSTRSASLQRDQVHSTQNVPGTKSTCSRRQWMEEFSHPVESLTLTVEEVINVRKVLVKAEMEKFSQNKDLHNNLKRGKVCCCCKVKFPLISWPSSCLFCKRAVCGSCSLKMKIPSKKLAHIPIYTAGFENIPEASHTKDSQNKGTFPSQSLKSLSHRSVEEEFPHLYTNGCSMKDVCTECAKFVADVINSSRKSLDLLNSAPSRKAKSMYTRSTRSSKL